MVQQGTGRGKLVLLGAAECALAVLAALFAFSCGLYAASRYSEEPLVSWGVCAAAVLYLSSIGAGYRWSIAFPLVGLGMFLGIGLVEKFSWGDWVAPAAWFVYVPIVLSLAAYMWHRRQGWLLPLAAFCSFTALLAQLCYTPWRLWYLFDTLGLLLMLAETTARSVASLYFGHYFYTILWKRRKERAKTWRAHVKIGS